MKGFCGEYRPDKYREPLACHASVPNKFGTNWANSPLQHY